MNYNCFKDVEDKFMIIVFCPAAWSDATTVTSFHTSKHNVFLLSGSALSQVHFFPSFWSQGLGVLQDNLVLSRVDNVNWPP